MSELASILEGSANETGDCSDSAMNFITPPGCDTSGGSEASGGVTGSSGGGSAGSSEDGGATAVGTGTTGSSESTGAMMEPLEREGGCGCGVGGAQGGGGSGWLLLAPWLLWARRRRG
jgi:hypothetical protein